MSDNFFKKNRTEFIKLMLGYTFDFSELLHIFRLINSHLHHSIVRKNGIIGHSAFMSQKLTESFQSEKKPYIHILRGIRRRPFCLLGKFSHSLSVPENVASGGQYACIFAEIQNDNEANEGIQTIPRAGLVVFGNVAGETKRLAKIGDIDISSVLFKGKISITANVENIGNIDFQSSVDVNVKSIFGKELYSDHLIYTVLPETTRKIYTEWNDTPFYGLFSLKTKVTALGTEVESERIILVMPPIMIAFTIVLASGIIISLMIYLKKKKAYSKQNDSEK